MQSCTQRQGCGWWHACLFRKPAHQHLEHVLRALRAAQQRESRGAVACRAGGSQQAMGQAGSRRVLRAPWHVVFVRLQRSSSATRRRLLVSIPPDTCGHGHPWPELRMLRQTHRSECGRRQGMYAANLTHKKSSKLVGEVRAQPLGRMYSVM